MKNAVFKIFIIFISTFLLFVYIFPWNSFGLQVPFWNKEYKLGLDLQWWIELDYKIDLEKYRSWEDYSKSWEDDVVEGLKTIIDKRIEVLNINDSEINDASYGNERHIIVQIPLKANDKLWNSKNIEKAKEAIGKVVKISFREKRKEVTEKDLQKREKIVNTLLAEIKSGEDFSVVSDKYKLNYENVETGKAVNYTEIIEDKKDIQEWEKNEVVNIKTKDESYLFVKKDKKLWFDYILISKKPSEWKEAVDSKWRVLDDRYFVKSSVQLNQAYQPEIILTFNDEWAKIFWDLTTRLVGRKMAIFVGWELLTAPNISEPIYGWSARITWKYEPEEANKLSRNINTWVVPAPIYLTSEKTIDSKIGTSSLEKLLYAWCLWFILIFVFLILVYRLSGVAASLALLVYIILILFIIKSTSTILTLASIAWLILSLWMAIDANILIFERIKWELQKWESLEQATVIWFKETWSAIWDSNLTGLIVALILFWFGINMIKWFGLMLAIWIVVSFFTVMVVSRVFLVFLTKTIKNKKVFIGSKE